jgi:hypothetical protein
VLHDGQKAIAATRSATTGYGREKDRARFRCGLQRSLRSRSGTDLERILATLATPPCV